MWVDDATLIVAIERGDTTRLAVVDVADPWPRRLATAHGGLCGWKSSGSTGKGGLGPYYVQQFMREQSRTVVRHRA